MLSTQTSKLSKLELNYKTKDKHYDNCVKLFFFFTKSMLGNC